MKKITILLILLSFRAFGSDVIPSNFKAKLERRLDKQTKKIKKHLKKKSPGQIQFYLEKIEQQNKWERMYGVDELINSIGNDVVTRYSFYATTEYKNLFFNTIENQISVLGGFENYLQTTGLSQSAKDCRLKRGAIIGSGVVLAGVSIFGGIGLGMLGSAVLSGSAIYMNPLSWTMVLSGVSAPLPTYMSFKKGYKLQCVGD